MTDKDDLSGRNIGEFVLCERIGEGGFGAVYRCEQPTLGRDAVVKVLHHRLRCRDVQLQCFLREAQLASRLDHPYAAHIYAFGAEEADGLLWIAMELVYGITLTRWLGDHGPMPLEQFVPFFEHVAEVVQTAHERGIVHRDLKPSNMMVIERAGRLLPKLLDFGVAKLLDGELLPESTPHTIKRLRALVVEKVPDEVLKQFHCHDFNEPAGYLVVYIEDIKTPRLELDTVDGFGLLTINGKQVYYVPVHIADAPSASKAGTAEEVVIGKNDLIKEHVDDDPP